MSSLFKFVEEHKLSIGAAAAISALGALYYLHGKQEKFVNPLGTDLELSTNDLRNLIKNFHLEMDKGLDKPTIDESKRSSLKMIPSFVGKPSGEETGEYYALDLGGTNFRVIRLSLLGGRKVGPMSKESFEISQEAMTGTAEQLFGFIAECVQKFIEAEKKKGCIAVSVSSALPLGFTFSFPVAQLALAKGNLIKWTKGFTTTGVEGNDVVALLNDAFKKRNIEVEVVALANDTVGTMLTRCYEDPQCEMGVILGTGTNACYAEKLVNIRKFSQEAKGNSMIINMEWGAFGDKKDLLKRTKMDILLDENSKNSGNQLFEKMISGMYLGEIIRYALLELREKDKLFQGVASHKLAVPYSFESKYASDIESDNSHNLQKVKDILDNHFNISSTMHERILVKDTCHLVAVRAARLSATAICAVLSKVDRLKDVSVAVDGSVFEHYPGFKETMNKTIVELFPESSVKLVLTRDGSGVGAAIIASVAMNTR